MELENNQQEIWQSIPGWESLYEVSNRGTVRSFRRAGINKRFYGGSVVGHITLKTGYLAVNFTCRGKRSQQLIHRLVLLAFAGYPPVGFQACHNNGIKTDNRLENLRWDSVLENARDRKRHGTARFGITMPNSRLTDDDVRYIRESDLPLKELAAMLGVSLGCICKAKYYQNWTHIL